MVGLDPDLWRWTVSAVASRADMEKYVRTALAERDAGRAIPFVIVDPRSGEVAGSTRFAAIDPQNRRMEIGWTWIGRRWQRTALNTEMKLLMLRHAFEEADCIRVELKTDALNERSRRAIRRLGAKEEGILRSHMVTHTGRFRDTVYHSILAAEWPAVLAHLEALLA